MGGFGGTGRRRFGTVVAAVVALVVVGAASAAQSTTALTRSSTFDSSAEGWVAFSYSSGFADASWQSSGGNPGGYITAQFDPPNFGTFQSTGSSNNGTWNPGNALGDYGGTLKLDLEASDPNSDAYYGFFSSNSAVLPCSEAGVVGTDWATYSVTLETGDLFDCEKVIQCTTPACIQSTKLTGAQVTAALAGFEAMVVLPSDTDDATDSMNLDNAMLSGPDVAVKPPTGKAARALTLGRYRRGKFEGTLTAANDYSCARKATVSLFEVRRGRSPLKVGAVKSSVPDLGQTDGPASFVLKVKVGKGTYYASVTKVKSSLDGNTCNAAKSKTVKVS